MTKLSLQGRLRSLCTFTLTLVTAVISSGVGATTCLPERSSYSVRDSQVWFLSSPPLFQLKLEDVDAASFREISPYSGDGPCAGLINNYARDKDHVFYRGKILAGADPETFVFIDDIYTKDKSAVYSGATRLTNRVEEFRRLPYVRWATDGRNYFYKETKFEGQGFERIVDGYEYARTSTHVYNRDKNLDVDPDSFEVIQASVGMTKDKNRVYYRDIQIRGADPKTFTQIQGYLFKDKRAVYLEGKEIVGLKPATARTYPLDGQYTADDSAVYKMYKKIDRDPATFSVLQPFYTKDKNAVYYYDVAIAHADSKTFVSPSMASGYDKNYRFYENGIECKINPAAKGQAESCKENR